MNDVLVVSLCPLQTNEQLKYELYPELQTPEERPKSRAHQWDDETVDKQLVGYTCWCSGHHPTTRKAAKAALAEPRRTDFGSESGENSYDCRIRYLTHVANYKFPGEP